MNCPCKGDKPFYCEVLKRWMGAHQAELCRTRPEYRILKETGRQKPAQRHWLTCEHRGKSLNAVNAGCGCSASRVDIYQCNFFHEPVLKRAADGFRQDIAEVTPSYTGRTCRECDVPKRLFSALPVPAGGLQQDTARGIITGANAMHWTCLGALAIAAYQQGLGFAVADHGLSAEQREELERIGVRWIGHERPENSHATYRPGIISDKNAWWKPWVCLASPFRSNAWIDADAVLVGPADALLASAPAVSTQHRFMTDGEKLYRDLGVYLFGNDVLPILCQVQAVNSGVLSWRRGDPLIVEWQQWCERLLGDPQALKRCTVRDQSALVMLLIERALHDKAWPKLLSDAWNWPADGLTNRRVRQRKSVPLEPGALLETTTNRHPQAKIVHWLGRVKPWNMKPKRARIPR